MCTPQISEDLMKVLEDGGPPPDAPLAAKYRRSFAFPSMTERVPVILTKVIDYIVRDKKNIIKSYGEKAENELKLVIGELSELKNHLQTAKRFQEFSSKSPDTELWNAELRSRSARADPLDYYQSDWLFAECYLYRRIRESFATKTLLKELDPFSYQKKLVLAQSIAEIGPHLKRLYDDMGGELDTNTLRSDLLYMIKCSLWSNRMDLSLSGGDTDLGLNINDQVKNWDANILVDESDEVLSLILKTGGLDVVDLVTDNGGVELLNDLLLADFLVTKCHVKTVRFRLKPMPWYVSDVTISDFHETIDNMLSQPLSHYQHFGTNWRKFVNTGAWKISAEDFWCLGLSYAEMPHHDPELFADLKASPLVIFKGDLNYRKLVQDRNWETTKPFCEALGDFSPVQLLALRTSKADTIAGLAAGVASDVEKRSPDWLISGEYGLIQFNKVF